MFLGLPTSIKLLWEIKFHHYKGSVRNEHLSFYMRRWHSGILKMFPYLYTWCCLLPSLTDTPPLRADPSVSCPKMVKPAYLRPNKVSITTPCAQCWEAGELGDGHLACWMGVFCGSLFSVLVSNKFSEDVVGTVWLCVGGYSACLSVNIYGYCECVCACVACIYVVCACMTYSQTCVCRSHPFATTAGYWLCSSSLPWFIPLGLYKHLVSLADQQAFWLSAFPTCWVTSMCNYAQPFMCVLGIWT